MISANLINQLKDSKERNINVIKMYKAKLQDKSCRSSDKIFMQNKCILLESENEDIEKIIKEYDNDSNRERKRVLGVY